MDKNREELSGPWKQRKSKFDLELIFIKRQESFLLQKSLFLALQPLNIDATIADHCPCDMSFLCLTIRSDRLTLNAPRSYSDWCREHHAKEKCLCCHFLCLSSDLPADLQIRLEVGLRRRRREQQKETKQEPNYQTANWWAMFRQQKNRSGRQESSIKE